MLTRNNRFRFCTNISISRWGTRSVLLLYIIIVLALFYMPCLTVTIPHSQEVPFSCQMFKLLLLALWSILQIFLCNRTHNSLEYYVNWPSYALIYTIYHYNFMTIVHIDIFVKHNFTFYLFATPVKLDTFCMPRETKIMFLYILRNYELKRCYTLARKCLLCVI